MPVLHFPVEEEMIYDMELCNIPSTKLTHFNIAPQNGWLEAYFPFGAPPIFRGRIVSFREANHLISELKLVRVALEDILESSTTDRGLPPKKHKDMFSPTPER